VLRRDATRRDGRSRVVYLPSLASGTVARNHVPAYSSNVSADIVDSMSSFERFVVAVDCTSRQQVRVAMATCTLLIININVKKTAV